MGSGNAIRVQLLPDFLEELVPQIPGGLLLREMNISRMSQSVNSLAEERNLEEVSGFSNECFVRMRMRADGPPPATTCLTCLES